MEETPEIKKEKSIDPWGSDAVIDHEHVYLDFNLSRITGDIKDYFKGENYLFDRDIIMAHRDFDKILHCIQNQKDFILVSGFASSGEFHYGHKAIIDTYKMFRKHTKYGYFAVCDVDAYVSRPDSKIPDMNTSKKYAVEDAIDALALGVAQEDIRVQSRQSVEYHNFAMQISKKITFNTMKAALGHADLGKFTAAYLQIADILYPQIENGPMLTLIPVGIDQEPLIRLARDVAKKFRSKYNFMTPSSVYIRHVPSMLSMKEKMSKSKEGSAVLLSASAEDIDRTVANAMTGGRNNIEEQRRLGGNPRVCPVYEMYRFNHNDSGFVKNVYSGCVSGSLSCGEDKKMLGEFLKSELRNKTDREQFRETARRIVFG
ncbi:MAG: tryptophan--tRNA ligase [Candidatus Micrarchaeota archaeon]|nr:tryptophan--tRNA ligase [Candidatus Micrarchaeota archaeon]